MAGSHVSSVQPLASSQLGAMPPTQAPLAQVSLVVQALPSSQDAALLVLRQPVAGSHESSVQPLASSQSRALPPMQAPPVQASFVVQALPSSHTKLLFAWTHPVAGSHESSVQSLRSSQLG